MTTTQIVEFAVTSTFNYSTFEFPALQQQALDTRNGFVGFCRRTLDQLIEQGSKLWNFYYQCISDLGKEKGKIAFDGWLESAEFGASQYIAKAAMKLSPWFYGLKPKLRTLVRQNVQNWSTSALSELTRISADLVEELIKGKQTRKTIKKAANIELKLRKGGYAKVLIKDHRALDGQIGQLVDKPDELGNVVLKMESGGTEEIFKSEDLQPVRKPHVSQEQFEEKYQLLLEKLEQQEEELNQYKSSVTSSTITPGTMRENVSQEQIDMLIARAIAEHEQKKAEEDAARYAEIREAAIAEANVKIESAKHSEIALAEANKKLQQQIEEKERELAEIRSPELQEVETENQRLRQRLQDLEKVSSESAINRLDYIEDHDASTTSELEKKYESLLEKVEQEERELDGYRASSNIELETAIKKEDAEALATELSTALELFGIPGWGRQGYCATNNRIYKGWDAVKAFLQEAFSTNQTSEK